MLSNDEFLSFIKLVSDFISEPSFSHSENVVSKFFLMDSAFLSNHLIDFVLAEIPFKVALLLINLECSVSIEHISFTSSNS